MLRLGVGAVSVVVAALVGGVWPAGASRPVRSPPAVLFESDGDLYAVAVDGSRTARLTRTRVDELDADASRDGRWIAYASFSPSSEPRFFELWKMSADGKRRIRLLRSRNGIRTPDWSWNGRTIYFAYYVDKIRYGATCGAIFRIGSSGRGLRRLTRVAPRSHSYPSVSPDGRRIALIEESYCEGGTTTEIVRVVDASGKPVREKFAQCLEWSPDGRKLLCPRWDDGLFVVNRDGSARRRLTPRPFHVDDAAWSPDGRWIAFVRGRLKDPDDDDYEYAVYRVDPRGKRLRRLTRFSSRPESLSWLARVPS